MRILTAAVALTLAVAAQAPAQGVDRDRDRGSSANLNTCEAGICAMVDVVRHDSRRGEPSITTVFLFVFDVFNGTIIIAPRSEVIDSSAFTMNNKGTVATLAIADASLAWTATDDFVVFEIRQTRVESGRELRATSQETSRPAHVEGFVGPLLVNSSGPNPPGVLRVFDFTERRH
jgi:hypothetical protein